MSSSDARAPAPRRPPPPAGQAIRKLREGRASNSESQASHPARARRLTHRERQHHLGDALDEVRRSEYRRLAGKDRSYIKGQRYTLLSAKANLTLDGRKALRKLLNANKR